MTIVGVCVVAFAVALPAAAQAGVQGSDPVNPGPNDIRVEGNAMIKSVLCRNNAVFVRGNSNKLQIGGTCTLVSVMGNANTLTVQRAARLTTLGNYNVVNYLDHRTQVNTTGEGNAVTLSK